MEPIHMNTFGWDTVYVLGIDRVNDALEARKNQLIQAFEIVPGGELPLTAKGTLASWQVVAGGSGKILHLKMTVGEGACTFQIGSPRTVDLAGIELVVAVQLHLLPLSSKSKIEELRFHIDRAGKMGQPNEPGIITPVALHDPKNRLDQAEKALLTAAMSGYIAANGKRISFVFATINLVPPSTESWLTPVRSAYVYADRQRGTGALGILSVTTDREIARLPRQVDAALLSAEYEASYGISQQMFLEHVIRPGLPQAFGHGTSEATFSYEAGSGSIVNTKAIPTDGIKEGAITYHPKIRKLSITTDGRGLRSSYQGDCDLKAGITMKFWINTKNPAVYEPARKTIAFLPDRDPDSRHEADIPWYLSFLGLLVKPIVEIVVKLVADGIAKSLTRQAGEKISLTRNPPTSIQWVETRALNVQSAAVDKGFFMQGTLVR
jgi:hypothetical protein